jgi:hypothetical protein
MLHLITNRKFFSLFIFKLKQEYTHNKFFTYLAHENS